MFEFVVVWNVALTVACAWLFYENAGIASLRRRVNSLYLQNALDGQTSPPPTQTGTTKEVESN